MSNYIFWIGFSFLLVVLFKNNFSKKNVSFDDILFFTAGFIYYMIIPYFYFFINKESISEGFKGITKFTDISEEKKCMFLVYIYMFYFLYVLISKYVKKRIKVKAIEFNWPFLVYDIITIPICLMAFYYLYRLRSSFMGGYKVDYNKSERGPLVTLSLFIFIMAIIKVITIIKMKKTKNIINWQMIIYWFIAFFILTIGTRLYFLATLITVFAIYFTYYKNINTIKFFVAIVLMAIIFSIFGIVRQGKDISIDFIVFIFLGEPLYTSYSLFSLLKLNELPWFNFPVNIFVDLINLVPTIILPNKMEIMKSLYIKYDYIAPLGAVNVFVNLMENFGIIGSFFFIIIFAFFVALLSKMMPYSYYIILGLLCFSFFREPFSVSIIKYLIQVSLFMPLFYYIVNRFFIYSTMKIKKKINFSL